MPHVSTRLTGVLLAIAAAAIWSIGGPIIRSMDAGPWAMIFWRSIGHAIGGPVLLYILGHRGWLSPRPRAGWRAPAVMVCMAISMICHVVAMANGTVAEVLITQSVSPFIIAAFSWIILRERVGPFTLVAMTVAFGGLALVFGVSIGGDPTAKIAALGSAAGASAAVLIVRANRGLDLYPATIGAALIAMVLALFLAPVALPTGEAVTMMALGFAQSTLGIWLFFAALRRLPATEVSLLVLLEPVLGPLWAWLFIAEMPAALTLVGGAVVLGAVAANTLARRNTAP